MISPMPPIDERAIPSRSEYRQQKRDERLRQPGRFRRGLGALALCATGVVGFPYHAFMYDQTVYTNTIWGDDKASIDVLSRHDTNPYDPETFIYTIPGTGVKSAHKQIAEPLQPAFDAIPNSQLMSLTESNHPQLEGTLSAIDRSIDMNYPPKRFILYGMSAGGKESLAIAAHLRAILPKTDITIILSSSPYDTDSAYELKGEGNTLSWLAQKSGELNLHGGPITRVAVEARNELAKTGCKGASGTFDWNECVAEVEQIAHDKMSRDATSNDLFDWQVEWTMADSADQDLSTLHNAKGRGRTSILYVNTTRDNVVDEDEAMPKYAKAAEKHNIPFAVVSLDLPHASENLHADIYNKALQPYLASLDDIYDTIDVRNNYLSRGLKPSDATRQPSGTGPKHLVR